MVDRVEKSFRKLPGQERRATRKVASQLLSGNFAGLDMKKLRGHRNIYRVRKGKTRVICLLRKDGSVEILDVGRRSEKTYRDY